MTAATTVPTGQGHKFKLNANADEPDTDRLLFREEDVTPRFGLSPNDAYDLALFKEEGSATRGVLVVTMKLQFFFSDGRGQQPGDVMRPLIWTRPEKQPFVDKFKQRVTAAWERKHRLITTSSLPTVKDVGVRFDLQTSVEGFDASDHWEVTVTKADGFGEVASTAFRGMGRWTAWI